jgi:starch-binding outer membrane protein, SusD/RagB family
MTITTRIFASARRAVLCVAAAGLVGACDNFLDPNPSDVLAPENFYKTSSDAIAAVNGIYEQQKWGHWLGFWYISDIATDDIIATANFGSDGHRMANYTFDPSEWPLGDMWGNRYTTINRANAVVERVPAITMDETLKARLLGEARFLRALSYFDLVRTFGDVPLLEHEVKSLKGLDVPRTPAAQVYALIVSDLQAAATALPASYGGADVGRVTSGAARTLLAKVYLTQKDWTNAAATAAQVISSARYSLNPAWKDNFRIATEITNPESIFELNYDGVLDPGAGSVMNLFSLPANFPGGDAYGLMQVTPSLVSLFASTDKRGNHGSFMISPYVTATNDTVTWALPAGAAFDKYLDETNTQNMTARGWAQQSNNWVLLRYADVLLMYAEAVNEGGTAGSMSKETALNTVRLRAGIAAATGLSQAAFRDSVRLERRREFVFEGSRWFDLSRWGILDAAMRAKTAEVAALYPGETTVHGVPSNLMPVPQSELDINSKLTQNTGW